MVIPVSRLISYISRSAKFTINRQMSGTSKNVKALCYGQYGEPGDVLQITESKLNEPATDEVSVKWLLAPINPADINTIQGKYPSRPPLPAVPGNEGVGEVVAVGSSVTNVCIGDKVIPNISNLGTWRTYANYKSTDVFKLPGEIGLAEASTISINPCTAYRMLKDFVNLQPGDTVIQNGSNSAVGQAVIQLCKLWNIRTVNVVRDRPDLQELKDRLICLGADLVLTEAEIRTTDIFKTKTFVQPKLALNCVCGDSATQIMRHLSNSGIMVTYGAMSRQPVTAPASVFIFKDITLKGFWMTAWSKRNLQSKERQDMFRDLVCYFQEKKLQAPPHKLIPFSNYKDAVTKTLHPEGKIDVKYILDVQNVCST